MEVTITIDGIKLDGLSAGSVKLNVQNVDPIEFSEPTVSYSGSISVPRSEVNDRVFRAIRYPWLYTRKSPYYANIGFGGLTSLIGSGVYRVNVTASKDAYNISLVDQANKLSDVNAPCMARPVGGGTSEWRSSLDSALAYGYGNQINRPTIGYPPYVNLVPTYRFDINDPNAITTAGAVLGRSSGLTFVRSYPTLDGQYYPSLNMILSNYQVALPIEQFDSVDFSVVAQQGSFVIMPSNAPATIYLVSNRSSAEYIAFTRGSAYVDGAYKYTANTSQFLKLRGVKNSATYFYFSDNSAGTGTVRAPYTGLSAAEAYSITLQVSAVSDPDAATTSVFDIGFTQAYDLVQAYCKAFGWTYDYTPNPFSVRLHPIVGGTVIDWTDKAQIDTAVYAPVPNMARGYLCKVGEVSAFARGSDRALNAIANGPESNLPVSGRASTMTVDLAEGTTGAIAQSWFSSPYGYQSHLNQHFAKFTPGWQVTCTMNLSYFDVLGVEMDAKYFIGELGGYFYLRSLQGWDASKETAQVTLIAINK